MNAGRQVMEYHFYGGENLAKALRDAAKRCRSQMLPTLSMP